MNSKGVRFQRDKNGQLNIVIPLTDEFMQTAERTAAILARDRDQMILEWFDWGAEAWANSLEDNCMTDAEFDTPEEVEAFIERARAARPRFRMADYAPAQTAWGTWIAEHPLNRQQREAAIA
jgi:hypothetical protein